MDPPKTRKREVAHGSQPQDCIGPGIRSDHLGPTDQWHLHRAETGRAKVDQSQNCPIVGKAKGFPPVMKESGKDQRTRGCHGRKDQHGMHESATGEEYHDGTVNQSLHVGQLQCQSGGPVQERYHNR